MYKIIWITQYIYIYINKSCLRIFLVVYIHIIFVLLWLYINVQIDSLVKYYICYYNKNVIHIIVIFVENIYFKFIFNSFMLLMFFKLVGVLSKIWLMKQMASLPRIILYINRCLVSN